MRLFVRMFTVVPLAVLLAGCGGSGASSAPTTFDRSAPRITADPAHLVLDAGDVGNGYLTIDSGTGKDTLAQTMHDDPAPIKAIERTSWISGYHALYTDTQTTGVVTDASVFRTGDVALRVSNSWRKAELKTFRGTPIAAPASLDHASMLRGTIPIKGRPTRAYFVQWVHSNVIAGILLFGRDASPQRLAGFATAQDGRISNAA